MKRLIPILLVTLFTASGMLYNVATCRAENQALKRECEAKAQKAADLIQTLGMDAALKKITDPQGAFVSETSHVFCIDAQSGRLLAHKVDRFVGSNMNYYMDADGNHPYRGILERAGQVEGGWTSYTTYGSGPDKRETPALKHMYFLKTPGKNIVLCCGYWEDS